MWLSSQFETSNVVTAAGVTLRPFSLRVGQCHLPPRSGFARGLRQPGADRPFGREFSIRAVPPHLHCSSSELTDTQVLAVFLLHRWMFANAQ